jgi:hypothetical protein
MADKKGKRKRGRDSCTPEEDEASPAEAPDEEWEETAATACVSLRFARHFFYTFSEENLSVMPAKKSKGEGKMRSREPTRERELAEIPPAVQVASRRRTLDDVVEVECTRRAPGVERSIVAAYEDRMVGDRRRYWSVLLIRYPSCRITCLGRSRAEHPSSFAQTGIACTIAARVPRCSPCRWRSRGHLSGRLEPCQSHRCVRLVLCTLTV